MPHAMLLKPKTLGQSSPLLQAIDVALSKQKTLAKAFGSAQAVGTKGTDAVRERRVEAMIAAAKKFSTTVSAAPRVPSAQKNSDAYHLLLHVLDEAATSDRGAQAVAVYVAHLLLKELEGD